MFIRSERLFLRPGWPEDWQELLSRIADESVVRNLAKAPWPYTAEDARWFASQPQDERLPHFFVTLPTSAAPAELIGCVGLGEIDGEVELGYWFARDHWGKGYATEAARAVLRLAKVLGHRHLVAGHFLDNPASGAVLRKAGFRPTGRVRERYSLARGCKAQSVEHRIELGRPSDCDGGGNDADLASAMRAA
ncbi:RimJ/RimL family protein N-acetyltransferase [Novosphingobium kunmingense]|uniref:RimJ/RimL family protein N-acetyltransferase n=1 Tax=Novosphingobium kunmingense TaxID=1211806 RepID=A0A2N0I449_9SPHN|nr:GNAT family N-acetyltransferase [Novosphingobium kunmingense]PKB25964.1 RimJ/RimL family protein N-acetyltransferase [Novosphingobium kunmingense]